MEDSGNQNSQTVRSLPSNKRKGGRYCYNQKSATLKHFIMDTFKNTSICKYCTYVSKGKHFKHTSNLNKHLKTMHKSIADEVEKETEERRPMIETNRKLWIYSSNFSQTKLSYVAKGSPYTDGSLRHSELQNALGMLFASNSLAYSLVESPEFRYFIFLFNQKFQLPNRQKMPEIIENIYKQLKDIIKNEIQNVKISIVLDIWSKNGLSESYLGVLAQYFDHKSLSIKKVLLGLKIMQGSHTAENIYNVLQVVLKEWEILEENILYYVTDNGANVVKALKTCIYKFIPLINNEICEGEETDLENTSDIEANLDVSFGDEDVNNDVNQFENAERDHNAYFDYSKRVSCIAHQVTCVIRKCVDGSSKLSPIIKAAIKLIKAITKSGNNKQLLLHYTKGKGLLTLSQTRWVYTYYVLDRLIELKEHVEKVVAEKEIVDGLDAIKWNQIKQIKDLLSPFAKIVKDLEGDRYTTLSGVLPALVDVITKLDDGANIGLIRSVKIELKKELENKFSKFWNPKSNDFSPTHLLATFLDPEYVIGLDNSQKEKCIEIIAHQLGKDFEQHDQNQDCSFDSKSIDLSQKKYPGWFKNVQLQMYSLSSKSPVNEKIKSFKMKLQNYVEDAMQIAIAPITTSDSGIDPLTFWCQQKEIYGEIAKYALDLLTVPASSAGIERVFSLASVVQGRRRYKLKASNTEKELFIKCNRHFLMTDYS